MSWEVTYVRAPWVEPEKLDAALEEGYEPFAVSGTGDYTYIWLKRATTVDLLPVIALTQEEDAGR